MLTTTLALCAVPASAFNVGDIIEFGNYPQTEIEKNGELEAVAGLSTWKSYGYYKTAEIYYNIGANDRTSTREGLPQKGSWMKYADFSLNDVKYRAVKLTEYRPENTDETASAAHSNQDNNGYVTNKTYYFKYEPLKWRVLNPSTGYIMCENAIDSQPYQNVVRKSGEEYYIDFTSTYANNYVSSSIRKWLNEDFYNTAFTDSQKAKIKETSLNNDAFAAGYSKYSSAATRDKIFLLSYTDANNSSYGFTSSTPASDAKGTDYAKCQGLKVTKPFWWYRTAAFGSNLVCGAIDNPAVLYNGYIVNDTDGGVRPVCELSTLGSDTAQFDPADCFYSITAVPGTNGHGQATGGGFWRKGDTVTLEAVPDEGYYFTGWYTSGGKKLSGDIEWVFEAKALEVEARFAPPVNVTVKTNGAGFTHGGGAYPPGASVTVMAHTQDGSKFLGWEKDGETISTKSTLTFTAEEDVTLTAKFSEPAKVRTPKQWTQSILGNIGNFFRDIIQRVRVAITRIVRR